MRGEGKEVGRGEGCDHRSLHVSGGLLLPCLMHTHCHTHIPTCAYSVNTHMPTCPQSHTHAHMCNTLTHCHIHVSCGLYHSCVYYLQCPKAAMPAEKSNSPIAIRRISLQNMYTIAGCYSPCFSFCIMTAYILTTLRSCVAVEG